MKKIFKIQTFDGLEFDSVKDAERHLNNIHGILLAKLSHNIVNLKFAQIGDYIDENVDLFVKLQTIKNDLLLENDQENDD